MCMHMYACFHLYVCVYTWNENCLHIKKKKKRNLFFFSFKITMKANPNLCGKLTAWHQMNLNTRNNLSWINSFTLESILPSIHDFVWTWLSCRCDKIGYLRANTTSARICRTNSSHSFLLQKQELGSPQFPWLFSFLTTKWYHTSATHTNSL